MTNTSILTLATLIAILLVAATPLRLASAHQSLLEGTYVVADYPDTIISFKDGSIVVSGCNTAINHIKQEGNSFSIANSGFWITTLKACTVDNDSLIISRLDNSSKFLKSEGEIELFDRKNELTLLLKEMSA